MKIAYEGIYLQETTWKPKLCALRAIGGCKLDRSTVRDSYMFTAHLYLSLSAYLLFEATWIELQPEMISILLSHSWIHISISTHEFCELSMSMEPGHNDLDTTDIVFGTGDEDEHARNQAPKLTQSLFLVIDNLIELMGSFNSV